MASHNPRINAEEDRRYREEFGVRPHAHESPSMFEAGGPVPDRIGTMKAYAYRGLGPKGYRRSDQRIHEDVCEALTEDTDLDPSSVEVTVQEGEVTLSGTVSSRHDKRQAENIAERVTGVRDVHNHLRVALPESHLQQGEGPGPMSPQDRNA
jgi:osmotically-inducible protein OsmY